MSIESHFDSGEVTFIAGGAIAQNQLVKLSAADTVVVTAANTDIAIGVAIQNPAVVSGEPVTIKLLNAAGTTSVIASVAIGFGVKCYPAAAGKVGVASAAGSVAVGVAKNAGSGDNDRLELIPVATGNVI